MDGGGSMKTSGRDAASPKVLAMLALSWIGLSCTEHLTQPTPGVPSFAIVIVTPSPPAAQVGTTLPALKVQVKDSKGKVLFGEAVNFVVTGGGGSVFAPTVVTDPSTGIAQE